MMCLGWANRYECAARVPVELTPSRGAVTVGTAAGAVSSTGCASALWFWIAGAVIIAGGVFKK